MGTTKTSFGTGGGKYALVAAIEGYDKLVVSGSPTTQPVTWTDLTNITAVGNTIAKTAGAAAWDATANGTRQLFGDGYLDLTFAYTVINPSLFAGLTATADAGSLDPTNLDFSFVADGSPVEMKIYESGAFKVTGITYSADSVYRIKVQGTTVTYWRDAELLYTSLTAASLPMLADAKIYQVDRGTISATLHYGADSAALNAWAATDWSTAIGGLRIAGTLEQEIDPWSTDLNPMELTLLIAPDANDTFGVACNQGGAGTESYLEYALDAKQDPVLGTAVVRVTDSAQFAAPAGTAYIGTERIDYTGNDEAAPGTLSGCTRGMYRPASRNSVTLNQMGRAHALPTIDFDVAQKPIVTSVARVWIGKEVAVHMHKVRGGVLDTKAESQRIFYGTIESIEDSEDGTTVVRCVSIEERLNRTVLLNDQWTAKVSSGIRLVANTEFRFVLHYYIGTTSNVKTAAPLKVVASGAAGAAQIDAGWYSAEEIAVAIQAWLTADGTLTWSDWAAHVDDTGLFHISGLPTAAWKKPHFHFTSTKTTMHALGWLQDNLNSYTYVGEESDEHEGARPDLRSDDPVLVYSPSVGGSNPIALSGARGTWFNNTTWLPEEFTGGLTSSNIGLVTVAGHLMVCSYSSDALLTQTMLLDEAGQSLGLLARDRIEVRSGGEAPVVKQIVVIEGSLLTILTNLFHSTGATSYNSAYDVFPAQLGAAIPYELCGANFITSLTALSESSSTGSLRLVLDRPTYLWDAISADLLLRVAWLVARDGELLFSTAVTPHASIASHTWTENDKQSADPSDRQRTVAITTNTWLRNVLKIKYNRAALTDDSYSSTLEVRFTRSIADHGERVQTIEARNSFGDPGSEAVESLAADLVTKVMPLYGQPLKKMKRPISLEFYEGVAPGDVAIITDPHMRDPATGLRSVTDKPALVVSHSRGYGSPPVGEAEVLYTDLDRAAIYSPAAEVASYAASVITCTAHAYSAATEGVDASNFAASDVITAIERDPTDPEAPAVFETTVASVSTNDITIDDAWAAYDSNLKYYVISRAYGDAAATQKTDCYYADTDDGRVVDARSPYYYADSPLGSFTPLGGTELAERHSVAVFDDGTPVCTGAAWALAQNVNNLANYATAAHGPSLFQAVQSMTSTDYIPIGQWPFHLGPVDYPAGLTRKLYMAPLMRSSSVSYKMYVRCTVSRWRPTGASDTTTLFQAPYEQLTFETISTTFETPAVQTVSPASPLVYPQGDGWLTMEAKVEVGHVGTGETWGLSKFYLGPLVSIS